MPRLVKRLQILLSEEQFERPQRRASESGESVDALVREAIDRAVPRTDTEPAKAIDELLALPPMPIDDWEGIEAGILESYERAAERNS